MAISDYQKEHLQTLTLVQQQLRRVESRSDLDLRTDSSGYLAFRRAVGNFLTGHLATTCNQKCYQGNLSACCSREGIIVFFADMVVNALVSSADGLRALADRLARKNEGQKCVYLGPGGCLWRIKPIVCEMFLCDHAQKTVLASDPVLSAQWAQYETQRKRFTWPDRPVLFDHLEQVFIEQGHSSALMYLNNSPGLLRVKKLAARKLHKLKSVPD